MPNRKSVKFFFDTISPYSYFGFEILTRHKNVWKTPVQLKPFFLPAVIRAADNANNMPLRVPAKEKYMLKDIVSCAQYLGLSFRLPKNYTNLMLTSSSIIPQRVLIAAQLRDESLMEDIARSLWNRFYAYGKPIFSKEDIEEVLRNRRVKDAPELMLMSNSAEVRNILRENTDEAIANGCFGAPWTHILDSKGNVIQTIFGADRLPQIADFLDEPFEGPMRERAQDFSLFLLNKVSK